MITTHRNNVNLFSPRRNRKAEVEATFNVHENKEEYVVYLSAPGIKREDLLIMIKDGQLIVASEKKESLHSIRDSSKTIYSGWCENFQLPTDADTLMTIAEYKNGELQIHIPKGNKDISHETMKLYVY